MHRILAIPLFVLATLLTPAHADDGLEVISLQHRSVEDMLPLLRPLLEPGGVLTGVHGQLILRASPSNRAQIRQALAALDIPLRQLRITVRQSLERAVDTREAELHGQVESGPVELRLPPGGRGGVRVEAGTAGTRIGARLADRTVEQNSRVTQQLQVTEGSQAYIRAGISRPLARRETIRGLYGREVRDSVVYQDIGSGFQVQPRLVGDRVSLDVTPFQQVISATDPRVVAGQQMHVTLTGRLGEWIEVGGGETDDAQRDRALAYSRATDTRQAQRVWLKVELVDE